MWRIVIRDPRTLQTRILWGLILWKQVFTGHEPRVAGHARYGSNFAVSEAPPVDVTFLMRKNRARTPMMVRLPR